MVTTEPIRVLLIEDDEDDYVLTRDLLDEISRVRFELEWVDSYERAMDAIRRDEHDVYLVDYRLGEHNGLELLREAKTIARTRPFILLTGAANQDIDLAAMESGAADYLVKGEIDARTMERSIRYSLDQSRTLAALRESEERYALSARGANDGLWVWDLSKDRVYYSPRWKEMLGFTEAEIGDSPEEWFGRVHPDDVETVHAAIALHRWGETPTIEIEHRMRSNDGEYRWMLARGLAERDANGESTRIAGSQTDVTQRKVALERLTHDAFHDTLTQLPNRALFMDRLDHALQISLRDLSRVFAVLFVDLDRFKLVNDSLGHAFGDRLLVAVAARLAGLLRGSDTVARLGGDEFAILLHGIDHFSDALRTAQRVHDELRLPFRIDEQEVFVTASIGVALSETGYEKSFDVLRDADIAMYRAKSEGRARHEVFDKTMHERAVEMLRFETDLRRAVEAEDLRVYYQPIVSLTDGNVIAFEALVRWQRDNDFVPADEIIRVAEDSGLIVPLGEWVLRESLRELAARHQGEGSRERQMHVNVSAKQLLQPSFVEIVRNALRDASVDPGLLHLEITESVLIANADRAAVIVEELREAGIGVSLDDFGTGYSSLSALRHYRFDTLKIDRSFVSRTANSGEDEIVRTISQLARLLGLRVIVEGVETEDQCRRMREIGINFAQGYYFSRPVPADEAWALAASRKT